jgi:hypothetical protein
MRRLGAVPAAPAAALVTGLLAGLVMAGPGASAVTVGETAKPGDTTGVCFGNALVVQDATAGGASYVAATAGVVTSWSLYSPTGDGVAQLKIARQGPDNHYRIVSTTQRHRLTTAGLNTFPTRLSIEAGETPALFVPDTTNVVTCLTNNAGAGDIVRVANGLATEPLDGASVTTDGALPGVRLDLSVEVEPDVDQDGFGDLTQDSCPSRADRQGDCAAPETTVKAAKKVRTSKKSAKVKVTLGSEAGATFVCVVDGGKPKPCAATMKVKLRLGVHHLVVAATDAAGNTDPTPAVATVKVVRKR